MLKELRLFLGVIDFGLYGMKGSCVGYLYGHARESWMEKLKKSNFDVCACEIWKYGGDSIQ